MKNGRTVSLESFLFIPSASTVLSNKSWRTSCYFTPLLFLARIPTFGRLIHQTSSLNLANAVILLNLRNVRVIFVYEVLECKKCLIFDSGRLLVFTKLRTNPLAAPPCVYNLCSFWPAYFERDSVSSLFGCGILIQNQTRRCTSSVKYSKVDVWNVCFFRRSC